MITSLRGFTRPVPWDWPPIRSRIRDASGGPAIAGSTTFSSMDLGTGVHRRAGASGPKAARGDHRRHGKRRAETQVGMTARRKILAAFGPEMLDVFFAEYVHAGRRSGGGFRRRGRVRRAAAMESGRPDPLGRRDDARSGPGPTACGGCPNRRADASLQHGPSQGRPRSLPTAMRTQTPIVAFTATRWRTLLEPPSEWSGETHPPQTVIDIAWHSLRCTSCLPRREPSRSWRRISRSSSQPPMSERDRTHWERFGDLDLRRRQGCI